MLLRGTNMTFIYTAIINWLRRFIMDKISDTAKEKASAEWKRVKKRAKATGGFFATYWKEFVIAGVLIATLAFSHQFVFKRGIAKSDAAWVAKYNAAVDDFNKRIDAMKQSSSEVADGTDKKIEKTTNALDREEQRVADKAAQQERDRIKSGTICPNTIDLNGKMPPEFFESWNRMNAAGAQSK